MRSRRLLSIALLGAVLLGASPDTDRYPRRFGIDVENYRFELTLRDDVDEIQGTATVSVLFTASGVTELPLDLISRGASGRGMEVLGVTSSGAALDYEHADDLLTVTLAEPGRSGQRVSVSVDYRGIPAAGLQIGPNKHGDRTFFSDNWPNKVRNWLPTVDHIGEKATVELIVDAPSHYQVVSNGLLIEETDHPEEGTRVSHWKQSVPISPWLYVLGVARFAKQTVDVVDGVAIETWVYAQDRDAGFYDFAVPSRAALEYYEAWVGPYAYEKLANITSPATGGGMEAASAIMYHENSVTGERTVRWRNVVIHEIAHQWFGNSVTESDWNDVWLSEGFATYFTLLFIEHAYGRDEFVDGLHSAADRVWTWYDANPEYRIVHADLDDMSRVTSIATYQKGAWVLHMLRERLGDEAFWEGIQLYYARHMNETASTEDFMQAMEEVSGDDLQDFFDQWLRRGGNPTVTGWWTYDASAQAVRIELNQTQDGLFDIPIDVGIYTDADLLPASIESLRLTDAFHRFVIPVDGEPSEVRLDPNTRLLHQADFTRR